MGLNFWLFGLSGLGIVLSIGKIIIFENSKHTIAEIIFVISYLTFLITFCIGVFSIFY